MVTGLGGIFIKSADPRFLARWYEDNLGIRFGNTLYFSFKWRELKNTDDVSYTVFSLFKEDTTYFYPANNDIMLNLRVNDLDTLRIKLKNDGAFVIDKVESLEYGRFAWVVDPAGNKIELWEPIDAGFDDRDQPMNIGDISGLSGVFLKCTNPESLMNWYAKHFGLFFSGSGHTFHWADFSIKEKKGSTLLAFYPEDSSYFNPSKKSYMISFHVKNLDELLKSLRSSDIEVGDKIEELNHGRFCWLLDPDGNKIELWEPVLLK